MNVAIYPFSDKLFAFAKWYNLLNNSARLTLALSPAGAGLHGHDASYAVNGTRELGVPVRSDYATALEGIDEIWVADILNEPMNADYALLASEAAQRNIPIKFLPQSGKTVLKEQLAAPCVRLEEKSEHFFDDYRYTGKFTPHAPVVMVGGFSKECGLADVAISTAYHLIQKGVRVAAITPEYISEQEGYYTYPQDFWTAADHSRRILSLNHFLYTIEETYMPQLFVIQMPDALMPFDDVLVNDFGYESYLVREAVSADYFIYCSDYHTYTVEMIKQLAVCITRRFHLPAKAFVISNRLFRYHDTQSHGINQFVYLPSDYLNQNPSEEDGNILMGSLENENIGVRLADHVLKALTR